MDIFDNNFKEILFSQLVSIVGGMIAGIVLVFYTDKLFMIPGLLIVLPGFLEMRGAISGTFASRLSSGLFLGVISPDKINTRLIRSNLIASFALALIVSLFLGFVGSVFVYFISGEFSTTLILITLVAAIIANFIEIPFAMFSTFYIFKDGHDPNNIIGPFILSTGDIVSIISLLIAVAVV